jgi:hypothetical protein
MAKSGERGTRGGSQPRLSLPLQPGYGCPANDR